MQISPSLAELPPFRRPCRCRKASRFALQVPSLATHRPFRPGRQIRLAQTRQQLAATIHEDLRAQLAAKDDGFSKRLDRFESKTSHLAEQLNTRTGAS
jgi:hypothetical protein